MDVIQSVTQNKKIPMLIGVVALLAVTLAFGLPRTAANAEAGYRTEAPVRGDLSITVSANGTARAYQSASLGWETTGVVEAVNAQAGERIQAGETLAVLEPDSLPGNVVLAEANLISAQQALDDLHNSAGLEKASAAITLRDTQEAYDEAVNYRELLNHEVKYRYIQGSMQLKTPMGWMKIPIVKKVRYLPDETQKAEADQDVALRKAEMEDAQRAYDRVKDGPNPQDVAAAEARLLAAQTTLNQAKIIAPFDGILTDRYSQPGDRISPGERAFALHDLSTLLVDLEVSEVDINSVSAGQGVDIRFDAIQGKEYQGIVVECAGAGSSSSGGVNFRVTVKVLDADEQIKPGMTAQASIRVREVEQALLIPNRAIRMLDGQRVVYVLREDETLEAIPVRLGVTSATYSEMASGNVREGDLIVLNPPTIGNK